MTVHVGKRQLDTFAPSPYRAPDGSLKWNVVEGEAGPLRPGQAVLAALHYVKGAKVWSLMGDMLSAVDAEGVVHTPRGGCLSRVPAALDRQPVTRTVDRLTACLASPPSTAALELRSKRRRGWGDELKNGSGAHPANYLAAECIQPDFVVRDPDADDE